MFSGESSNKDDSRVKLRSGSEVNVEVVQLIKSVEKEEIGTFERGSDDDEAVTRLLLK